MNPELRELLVLVVGLFFACLFNGQGLVDLGKRIGLIKEGDALKVLNIINTLFTMGLMALSLFGLQEGVQGVIDQFGSHINNLILFAIALAGALPIQRLLTAATQLLHNLLKKLGLTFDLSVRNIMKERGVAEDIAAKIEVNEQAAREAFALK